MGVTVAMRMIFRWAGSIMAAGDERSRRRRMTTDRKPRGADLAKSAQQQSANRTSYSALPLAA